MSNKEKIQKLADIIKKLEKMTLKYELIMDKDNHIKSCRLCSWDNVPTIEEYKDVGYDSPLFYTFYNEDKNKEVLIIRGLYEVDDDMIRNREVASEEYKKTIRRSDGVRDGQLISLISYHKQLTEKEMKYEDK